MMLRRAEAKVWVQRGRAIEVYPRCPFTTARWITDLIAEKGKMGGGKHQNGHDALGHGTSRQV